MANTDTANKWQCPGDDSPPKQVQKKTKGKTKINIEGTKCSICESVIATASKTDEGDDALFVKVFVKHGIIENVLILVSNYLRLYVNLRSFLMFILLTCLLPKGNFYFM